MGIVVNSNIPSISASRALYESRAAMEQAMNRLSSGKRINSASDDAAGMSIASNLRSQVVSLNQAVRNSNDGISYLEVYDGTAAEIEDMLVRFRELQTQFLNSTYSSDDQAALTSEMAAIQTEVTNLTTNRGLWNGTAVSAATLTVQSGSTDADVTTITLGDLDVSSALVTDGTETLANIDAAITALNAARGDAAATRNALTHAVSNAMNISQRTAEALSRVEDADFAAESAALARANVLAQAGTAMLAQANQTPQYILTLLRG